MLCTCVDGLAQGPLAVLWTGMPSHAFLNSSVSVAQGDVFEPTTWEAQLRGAVGVISTIGAFGSNEFMYRSAFGALSLIPPPLQVSPIGL